jgi:threonyl-tRNA synthetase
VGVRVNIDHRSETINYRIREAQVQQVPYMIVIGDKELASKQLSVRHRREGDLGLMSNEQLLKKVQAEIAQKSA